MKIKLNKKLSAGDLLDLENHLVEKDYPLSPEDVDQLDHLAIDGTMEIGSEEIGAEVISFLGLNVDGIIIWKDGVRAVDGSPLDFAVESRMKPQDLVERMLGDTQFVVKKQGQFLRKNPNTQFPDIPNNWVSNEAQAEIFPEFGEASSFVQVHLRGRGVEIVAAANGVRENAESVIPPGHSGSVFMTEPDRAEYATAEEAIAAVEKRGSGSVIKFYVTPNQPGRKPDQVYNSTGMWSFNRNGNGKWQGHDIYTGHGRAYGDAKPSDS